MKTGLFLKKSNRRVYEIGTDGLPQGYVRVQIPFTDEEMKNARLTDRFNNGAYDPKTKQYRHGSRLSGGGFMPRAKSHIQVVNRKNLVERVLD